MSFLPTRRATPPCVEAADGSGAVLGSNDNIVKAGDAEGNVMLTDGEGSTFGGKDGLRRKH